MGLQSGMIEFEVDQTQLQRIELKLKDMKAKAPQALKNAVNATARDAKKDLADKAKETYCLLYTSYWQRGETLDYKNTGSSTIEANTVVELTGRVGIAGTDLSLIHI